MIPARPAFCVCIDQGRMLGQAPNKLFDEAWYRARNSDIEDALIRGEWGSGYEHHCAIGYLARSLHWLCDEGIYSHCASGLRGHCRPAM